MRKLKIDQALFLTAFERDVDYEPYWERAYLDLVTTNIEWFYVEDDEAEGGGISAAENRTQRERIEAEPDRFLLIPGRSHGEQHDILQAFLASDWTDSESMRKFAQDSYFGSIGGWKKAIKDEDIIQAFYDFRDDKMVELAEAFLLDNGVEVEW